MEKTLLSLLLSCFVLSNLFAQSQGMFFNNNSTVVAVSGTIIKADTVRNQGELKLVNSTLNVSKDIYNGDSLLSYTSKVLIGNDYKAVAGGVFFSVLNSEVDLVRHWDNGYGTFKQSDNGYFRFNGASQAILATNTVDSSDVFGTVEINGGGVKVVTNNLFFTNIVFNNGVLKAKTTNDTLVALVNGSLPHGSTASHIQGELFMIVTPAYSSANVLFPLGLFNGGSSVYSPIEIEGITITGSDSSIFKGLAINGPLSTPQLSGGLQSLYGGNNWQLLDFTPNNHDTFKVKLFADKTSVGSTESSWVVAESSTNVANSTYSSLGRFDFGQVSALPSYVTSNYDAGYPYLAIGTECNTLKLAVKAKLQGVNTVSTNYQKYLDTIYVQGGVVNSVSSSDLMLVGAPIHSQTIDLVTVYLRNTASPSIVADSISGWLLANNNVVDYKTANTSYLEFCPAAGKVVPGVDYFVEINQKNHIPVATSSTTAWTATTITPTALDAIDFTLPSTHYSVYGHVTNAGVAELSAGNVTPKSNLYSLNRVDAADVFLARLRAQVLPSNGYYNEDVNVDGKVDVLDYNLVVPNAQVIRRAVLPY